MHHWQNIMIETSAINVLLLQTIKIRTMIIAKYYLVSAFKILNTLTAGG